MSINLFWHICMRQQLGSARPGQLHKRPHEGSIKPWQIWGPGLSLHPPCGQLNVQLVGSEQRWGVTHGQHCQAQGSLEWTCPQADSNDPVCDSGAFPWWGELSWEPSTLGVFAESLWSAGPPTFVSMMSPPYWVYLNLAPFQGQSPQPIQCKFLRKQNKKQFLAFLAGPEVVKLISDMFKVLSVCLCFRKAKSCFVSVDLPFSSSLCSPVEVSVVPACFLRDKLQHAEGDPEIKKETDTQLQLQLSLPDLCSWAVLQSHL